MTNVNRLDSLNCIGLESFRACQKGKLASVIGVLLGADTSFPTQGRRKGPLCFRMRDKEGTVMDIKSWKWNGSSEEAFNRKLRELTVGSIIVVRDAERSWYADICVYVCMHACCICANICLYVVSTCIFVHL
jgi:hypothetical protein